MFLQRANILINFVCAHLNMKLLFNAKFYTLDENAPTATALVIDRERIVAIGDDELAEQFPFAEKENMDGRAILPGLTDAHFHLQSYALSLQKVDCETSTRAECLRRVAQRVQVTPPGQWILGHGWAQNDWPEGFGSAALLDEIAPNQPVYLTAKSLHAAWANTAALQLAGINANTPDPENGKVIRNEQGEATGILLETATHLVETVLPISTPAQVLEALSAAQPILWKLGLTGIHDFDQRDCFIALQKMHEHGELKLRVTKSIPVDLLSHAQALGLRTGFGDDMLRIGSLKVFMDGALGPRTAAMFKPYLNEPENQGILNMDGEGLFEIGREAAGAGLSMAVHAIGDRANHEVLNAFEHLRGYEQKNGLPALRHRIEHVQILHPDDAARLGQQHIIASMQPIHVLSDMFAADQFWGERSRLGYAWRTQLENGAILTFGSDAPVESPNPFWGLRAAITRRRADGSPSPAGWHPQQRLDIPDAIRGFTTGPAYAAGMEDHLGRLKVGYLADLIVLEKDPYSCDPDEFLTMQPAATMVNGEWVWRC
jgi:predicted amidohydrolase YtcJ